MCLLWIGYVYFISDHSDLIHSHFSNIHPNVILFVLLFDKIRFIFLQGDQEETGGLFPWHSTLRLLVNPTTVLMNHLHRIQLNFASGVSFGVFVILSDVLIAVSLCVLLQKSRTTNRK